MSTPDVMTDQHKLKAVLRLSQLLGSSLRLIDVLDNAMRALEEFLHAGASSVYQVDYEAGELFFRHARGAKADHLKEKRIKIGEGVAGWVAKHGEPMLVENPTEDERFSDRFDKELGYKTQSMMTVPLISKGAVIGVIQILNKDEKEDVEVEAFTTADLELAQIMAGPIAVAIENAGLYSKLEEKQEQTEEELRRTQERLIRTERQAALSGLAQGIAHQLRNPAMSIGGFARLIKEKVPPEMETIRKYASIIIEENNRLEELVRKVRFLIDLSPKLAPISVNEMVKKAVCSVGADRQDIEFVKELAEDLPRVYGDEGLLTVALEEILRNGAEAQAEVIRVRTNVKGDEIWIEVLDDGEGFDSESLSGALDPFYSTRAQNLGLGLAVVHRIVEEHQGKVDIGNLPERGSHVSIMLPLRGPRA